MLPWHPLRWCDTVTVLVYWVGLVIQKSFPESNRDEILKSKYDSTSTVCKCRYKLYVPVLYNKYTYGISKAPNYTVLYVKRLFLP